MAKIFQFVFCLLIAAMPLAAAPNTSLPAGSTDTTAPHFNKQHLYLVAGAHVALWAGSYVALNKAWYADYPRTSFHFFNDNSEWNQMDKLGHAWTSYQVSRVSAETWKWTGMPTRAAVLLGSASAMAYQSIIEIQDGFSSQWGFSWGDMTANFVGAAGYAAQELGWKEQRVIIKLSYFPYQYEPALKARRDQLFGSSLPERILKDYNSQTYWLSANISSFLPSSHVPRWINLSVGYGSELMLGGTENVWIDKTGSYHDRRDITRYRQFFLSPDIDFTRIHTRKKFVRGLLFALNTIKMPAPTIELSKGKLRLFALYY